MPNIAAPLWKTNTYGTMAFDEHNAAWADEFKELYVSLSPEEYNAAMESTLTAFYAARCYQGNV